MDSNAGPGGSNRPSRAQSAPPQSDSAQQRFVSKIEIQPNHNQQPQPQAEMNTSEMYIPTGGNNENQAPQHGELYIHLATINASRRETH